MGSYDEVAGQIAEEEGFDSAEELEKNSGGRTKVLEEVRYRMIAQFLMDEGIASK